MDGQTGRYNHCCSPFLIAPKKPSKWAKKPVGIKGGTDALIRGFDISSGNGLTTNGTDFLYTQPTWDTLTVPVATYTTASSINNT